MLPEHFTEATLSDAETTFQKALSSNDIEVLDQLLHEAVRFIGPDGRTIDKAADIASHRAEEFVLSEVEELERDVQLIDGVGVTRATLHLVGTAGEQPLDVLIAYTRTWVSSTNGWQIIAAHGSVVEAR